MPVSKASKPTGSVANRWWNRASRCARRWRPVIGYDKAAEIAKKAYKEGKTVREVAREISGLSEKQLDEIFNLRALTEPGIRGKGGE